MDASALKENPAITRFVSATLSSGVFAFLIKPFTGKTHQIRVALKSVGSPIKGDTRYAAMEDAKVCDRGYLHAYALKFTLNADEYEFKDIPNEGEFFLSDEFQTQLEVWSKPEEYFK